jgi:hypothetical protein
MSEDAAVEWLENEQFGVLRRGRANWSLDPKDVPDALTQVRCVHRDAFGGEPIRVTVLSLDGFVCVISLESPRHRVPPGLPRFPDDEDEEGFRDGEAIYAALVEEYGQPVSDRAHSDSAVWWRTQSGDELNLWVVPDSDPFTYCALNFFDLPRWSLAGDLVQTIRSKNLAARGARYGLGKPRV